MKRINVVLVSMIVVIVLSAGCNGSSNESSSNSAKSGKSKNEPGITITLQAEGEVGFKLNGEGTAVIDWGDGSPVESVEIRNISLKQNAQHTYAQASEYTIRVTGENIKDFLCDKLAISNLVVNVPTLEKLICRGSEITSLDMSNCPQLRILVLEYNEKLNSLNISKNSELSTMECCGSKQITGLDLSKNPALGYFKCWGNKITSLDLSKNTKLVEAYCGINEMSADALNALLKSLHDNDVNAKKIISIADNPGTDDCDKSIAENKGWIVR
ncbi:MAG: hypothetical protein FWF09_04480 [Bacteroidales bacterium]|nr:hypothetical protein [Bacteroidales bacterium]